MIGRIVNLGSPPRAWGQSTFNAPSMTDIRFTPTGVGTMAGACCRLYMPTVHPHGRGDNEIVIPCPYDTSGSPPRAWGQWLSSKTKVLLERFTPTGVGTIRSVARFDAQITVHPHGRGDNGRYHGPGVYPYGSPPRAWGQSLLNSEEWLSVRFTPTGVGTIAVACTTCRRAPVHPHGRGDNPVRSERRFFDAGSPPRAWGQ